MENRFFDRSAEDILREFDTDIKSGLAGKEAKKRQKKQGKNNVLPALSGSCKKTLSEILYGFSFFVMFAFATIMLYVSSKKGAAIATLCVLFVFFALSVLTYLLSDKVIRKSVLHRMTGVKVIRDSRHILVSTKNIVRGDIVELVPGDTVPADLVVVKGEVFVREGSVTGYRGSHKKSAVNPDFTIGESSNILFASSIIEKGTCLAVCAGIGEECEIVKSGRIGRAYDLKSLYCLKSIDKFSSFAAVIAFTVSLVCVLCAFLRKMTGENLIDGVFTAVVFSSSLICEFSFVAAKAIIAARLGYMLKNNGQGRAIITDPSSLENLSNCDCIITNADTFFDSNNLEIIATASSGLLYNKLDMIDNSDVMLFLRSVAVCESAAQYNPITVPKDEIEISPYSRVAYEYCIANGGESKFRLGYKKSKDFDCPFDISIILGREKFGMISGSFDDVLANCDTVIYGKKPKIMEHKDRASIRTVASGFLNNGYNVVAYARKIYTDEEIANENFSLDSLQFYGIIAYKCKMRDDADSFFSQCIEKGVRPIVFCDKAKYMLRELKQNCPSLSDTRFCVGSMMDTASKTEEFTERYDFFLDFEIKQKSEIAEALTSHGYNVCLYTDCFDDIKMSGHISTVISKDGCDDELCEGKRVINRKYAENTGKCGALCDISDAICATSVSAIGILGTAKKIYRQLELSVRFLVCVFSARLALYLLFSIFPIATVNSAEMLTYNLFGDLLGIICIALSLDKINNRENSDFSLRFYLETLESSLPSAVFALLTFFGALILKIPALQISASCIETAVFVSMIFLSPLCIFSISSETRSFWTLGYFFIGAFIILLTSMIPSLGSAFGVSLTTTSVLLAVFPLFGYIITTMICHARYLRAKKAKEI